MLRIEGDRDPRRHQACDGRDGGMMRLRGGIEDDVDQRPRQLRRIQEIGLHQNAPLGAPDTLEDRVRRTAVGLKETAHDVSQGPWPAGPCGRLRRPHSQSKANRPLAIKPHQAHAGITVPPTWPVTAGPPRLTSRAARA
jgi:hypothetical protein